MLGNAWAQKLKGEMIWGIAETTKFDKVLSQKEQSEFIGVISDAWIEARFRIGDIDTIGVLILQEHPGQKFILTNFEYVADYGWVDKTAHSGVYLINTEAFAAKAKGFKVKLRTTIWENVHYVVSLQKIGD